MYAVATAPYASDATPGNFSMSLNFSPTAKTYGLLISVSETLNASPTLTAIPLAGTIPNIPATADANVSAPAALTLTPTINALTPVTAEALWKNTDKPSPGSISNVDKP